MKTVVVLSLGTAALLTANSVSAEPAPAPIAIKSVDYSGTGCADGSVTVDIAPDGGAFTVIYSDFLAQIGPGVARALGQRECNIKIGLDVPAGITYAVMAVDYRGYASIAPGAVGAHRAVYHFQGEQPLRSRWTEFSGPAEDDWHVHEDADVRVFKKCGQDRKVQIKTELKLDKGTSAHSDGSYMTMDSTDGEIRDTYVLAWKTCNGNGNGNGNH